GRPGSGVPHRPGRSPGCAAATPRAPPGFVRGTAPDSGRPSAAYLAPRRTDPPCRAAVRRAARPRAGAARHGPAPVRRRWWRCPRTRPLLTVTKTGRESTACILLRDRAPGKREGYTRRTRHRGVSSGKVAGDRYSDLPRDLFVTSLCIYSP